MTKKQKIRYMSAVIAAIMILSSFTACKSKPAEVSSDTGATTVVSENTTATTETTDTTTEATTVATTATETTVATAKATTKAPAPNTTVKPKETAKPTTKAPVTQAPARKTQLDANGISRWVQTPEEICKEQNWTLDEYKTYSQKVKEYKCKYCDKQDCASIVRGLDTQGDYSDIWINLWNCPTYVASEPKCDRCGKKLCQDYDAAHSKEEYCTGWHKQVEW